MIDVEPLIVSVLDRLVPLPSSERADWNDVLRRSGVRRRRSRAFGLLPDLQPRLRLMLFAVALALVLAGIALAASLGGHGLLFFGDGSATDSGAIYLLDGHGKIQRLVGGYGFADRPDWAPNGKTIAFDGPSGGIFVMRADGSGKRLLSRDGGSPIWSRDGKQIAFIRWARNVNGYRAAEIFVMRADGRGVRRLTHVGDKAPHPYEGEPGLEKGGLERPFVWAPGREIVFVVDERSGGSDLYSVDAASGRIRQLTRNAWDGSSPASAYSPAWSPDGRRIAFTRSPMGLIDPNSELYVMNADGSGQRRLTRGFRDNYPAWSPDGRKIAFLRVGKDGKASELDVIDADGRGRRHLATGNLNGLPEWSPNGNQIAFQRGTGLWIINADGSGERRVAQRLAGLSGPIWRPGG